MSVLLWLIPIGAYVWFAYFGDERQKETVKAYFWTFIIVFGALGAIYTFMTTGAIPAGCCGY